MSPCSPSWPKPGQGYPTKAHPQRPKQIFAQGHQTNAVYQQHHSINRLDINRQEAPHAVTLAKTIVHSANIDLGGRLPLFYHSDKNIPRYTRTTLAQLISGWRKMLISDKSCPGSIQRSPTTAQIATSAHTTSGTSSTAPLNVASLWTRPCETAIFFNLEF